MGAYQSFQSVIGAISLTGSLPTASELITTTGRVFRISDPMVGSSVTSHTSPRLGSASLVSVFNDVPSLPIAIRLILRCCFVRLFRKHATALCEGKFQEGAPFDQS